MKINIIEMIKDELGSAEDYYKWSIDYKEKAKTVSLEMFDISKQELQHAWFWIDMATKVGKNVEVYLKKYNEIYKMIYGGEFNE